MIEFKIKGHVLRLTRAEWNNIKARFDPKNAVLEGRRFLIRVPCKLCAKYKREDGNCTLCPFQAFVPAWCINGCLDLLEQIFPKQCFIVNTHWVFWQADENSYARRQLNSIQKRMKRTEESQ